MMSARLSHSNRVKLAANTPTFFISLMRLYENNVKNMIGAISIVIRLMLLPDHLGRCPNLFKIQSYDDTQDMATDLESEV